jgi:hypothetical protein
VLKHLPLPRPELRYKSFSLCLSEVGPLGGG